MSWHTCRLGDVVTLKRGHDLPESLRHDGDVPVISSSGITGYHNDPGQRRQVLSPGATAPSAKSSMSRKTIGR